jgi:hypothetical protein
LAGQMFAVAAEGGGRKAELSGQGAVRRRGHETSINLRPGGVIADGTAFDHTYAPRRKFPQGAGWVKVISGRGAGPASNRQITRKYLANIDRLPISPQQICFQQICFKKS